jgi:ADP-dependent NAD(P)H-hydrate dehydratase / NAD(P)H-hydrate epimerase
MLAVVPPDEMRAIDAASPIGLEVLIERAGAAVARVALEQLGGAYGRRVVVVCGKGNNGADGRVAARQLRARGVRVLELPADEAAGTVLPACDLVIDAGYGTGFRGSYDAPDAGDAMVLAVDVPSGDEVIADVTVTFAALKPSLVFDPEGRAGAVVVEDIGLDVSSARTWLVEPADVLAALPRRARDAHKYAAAVAVIAGSPGMTGAASLTSRAVLRAGSGYCRLGVPGADVAALAASEVVAVPLPAEGWASAALAACDRMRALAIGPGLGRSAGAGEEIRRVVGEAPVPVVVDADGLDALGRAAEAAEVLASRAAPAVLTPHDGEFARLAGSSPPAGSERIDAVRSLAADVGAVVLLKGPVTVVAGPSGEVRLSRAGSPALATAGTGDVLTGVIASFLAQGLAPLDAAALGACAHGTASLGGLRVGLVASDLLDLLPRFLSGAGAR